MREHSLKDQRTTLNVGFMARLQRKHVVWFLEHRLNRRSELTRYYYLLTIRLLARRLEKPWVLIL
ncbi:hypothetical protein [Pseudomonas sp. Irchel s3h17]|uniref:hypothetical protein n=1 Tax=Pseudomonas sp. Irchel s3h17 TaxID=2009182 RepID=UPI000BA49A8B|nr:hypothetical protein [Pseudomonas sp. Irchel s3h17]